MKPLLGLLIAIVAWCGVARAEKLTPRAFTQEIARALTAALPSTTVTIKDDLELELSDRSGLKRTLRLANAYQDYSLDPTRFGEVVQAIVAALSRSGSGQAKLDPSRIVPVIKDRQWLVDLHKTLKARGAEQEHLSDDVNNELVIVYAEDDPARMRYLTKVRISASVARSSGARDRKSHAHPAQDRDARHRRCHDHLGRRRLRAQPVAGG